MTKLEPVASEEMVKNALGEEGYDELAEPTHVSAPLDHVLWPKIKAAIKEIYDPEIPVNIYELGLIYSVAVAEPENGVHDVDIKMTLTSPGCPVAQEMPGWVQAAVLPLEGVGGVTVEIVWDPSWDPSMMAETAKMQLNMFF
ncbi:MAG: iron-sulfur cluster assembly protein [Alphaproteobacteria bacterium]|nr:iron-sulfur cluster assembly protein [Alphaproteobacteria bacterium]